jgi:hypothetical protein
MAPASVLVGASPNPGEGGVFLVVLGGLFDREDFPVLLRKLLVGSPEERVHPRPKGLGMVACGDCTSHVISP